MLKSLVAAIAFYTCLPIANSWSLDFRYVARFAPAVGLMIGGLLALEDGLLGAFGMPMLTRSALIIASWLLLTGGLHMDGAMDTADGLAVMDSERRLEVMADSHTGAFGAMVAVIIVVVKVAALSEVSVARPISLIIAPMWGRWAQQLAIAYYPYLKATGKGAFHKEALQSKALVWISGLGCWLVAISGWWLTIALQVGATQVWTVEAVGPLIGSLGSATGLAIAIGKWLDSQLGGHTGDTYGAVVEWTEVSVLVLWTLLG